VNPTATPLPTPPPPAGTATPAAERHSARRVVAAAMAGLAVGVAGVSLPWSSPTDGTGATQPAALPSAIVPAQPSAGEAMAGDGTAAAGAAATTDAGTTNSTWTMDADGAAPQPGVVDQAAAEQAALAYLGQGRVTWVTPEDDRGAAWEVEVTLPNGREVDVLVDARGQVIATRQGLARWLP
jgi:hypothetical protein